MIEKLVPYQVKNAKILFLMLIVVIILGTIIATDIKVDPDFGTLVPKNSQYNTNDRILKKAFEINDAMVLYISIDKLSTLRNISSTLEGNSINNYFQSLRNIVSQSQYVREVSPVILSDDKKSAQIIASISTPQTVGGTAQVKEEIKALSNQVGTPAGVKIIITGFPVMLDRISTFLIQDNLDTILITIVAIFLILFWYSKDFYFSLITLSIPTISLTFLAALMVLLGINVTITLAAVGVLALGLGVDYSIHISIHYQKGIEKHKNHLKALEQTLNDLQLPITASFITTLAGFGALMFGVSPSSQAQGIVLSLTITIIYFTTLLIFPVLITVFAKKIDVKPNILFNKILQGLGNFAKILSNYSKLVLWTLALITVIMIYGASQVQFSTSNSNWIPDDDEVSSSFREVVYDFGGNRESLTILLESTRGDLRTTQVVKDIQKLTSQLKTIPNVDSVSSPFDNLDKDSNNVFNQLTNNQNLKQQFNHDWTLSKITIVTRNPEKDEEGKSVILKELKNILKTNPIYNTKTSLYGNAVRFDELGDSLQQDAAVTTMLGLGLVFFVASTIYA